MRALLAALALGVAAPVMAAEPRLITDLSESRIDISYRFAGAELLVYGAIQYPGGRVPGSEPGIAIVVRGPSDALTVRQKERVAGIWINTEAMRFESVPGFYAVATTAPVRELLDERNAAIHEIGLDHLQLSPATAAEPDVITAFQDGLVSLKQRTGLYVEVPGGVRVTENTLYRARIPIPAAVPVGEYRAEIYLIRRGRVLARSSVPIVIDKTGFERNMFLFAQDYGFLYGLTAIAVALGLGWVAGSVTRRRAA